MSDTWLSPEDVTELTAKKRWAAQCRALAEMGVPFRPNAVGRPLVERSVICTAQPIRKAKKPQPYWGPIRGASAQ